MRIVAGKCHLGLEVATVVHGLLVEDDEGDAPFEDVLVDELRRRLAGAWLGRQSRDKSVGDIPRYLSTSPCSAA